MHPKVSLLSTLLHVPWSWGVWHAPAWPSSFWGDWGIWSLAEHEEDAQFSALELRSSSGSSCTALNFFIPLEKGGTEDFYCIWTEDTSNKLPSFNLLFQSFLYLLIAIFLLWDRINWQRHFLDFLQNFNNSFTGEITLAVSQVAFILSEEIYVFIRAWFWKFAGKGAHFEFSYDD